MKLRKLGDVDSAILAEALLDSAGHWTACARLTLERGGSDANYIVELTTAQVLLELGAALRSAGAPVNDA